MWLRYGSRRRAYKFWDYLKPSIVRSPFPSAFETTAIERGESAKAVTGTSSNDVPFSEADSLRRWSQAVDVIINVSAEESDDCVREKREVMSSLSSQAADHTDDSEWDSDDEDEGICPCRPRMNSQELSIRLNEEMPTQTIKRNCLTRNLPAKYTTEVNKLLSFFASEETSTACERCRCHRVDERLLFFDRTGLHGHATDRRRCSSPFRGLRRIPSGLFTSSHLDDDTGARFLQPAGEARSRPTRSRSWHGPMDSASPGRRQDDDATPSNSLHLVRYSLYQPDEDFQKLITPLAAFSSPQRHLVTSSSSE